MDRRLLFVQLDYNKVDEKLDFTAADINGFSKSQTQTANHMLASLRLVAKLDCEFVARKRIAHILILVVALRWYIVEDKVWLLDESTFQLDTLGRLEAELFFELSLSDLLRLHLLLDFSML